MCLHVNIHIWSYISILKVTLDHISLWRYPYLVMCLIQSFYSCTVMTKNQVETERLYLAYNSMLQFITKGSQDWNSSRSGSRGWCRGHGEMILTGLLLLDCTACCLTKPRSISPAMAPPRDGITNNGTYPLDHQLVISTTDGSHGGTSPTEHLCDNSSLWHVDT